MNPMVWMLLITTISTSTIITMFSYHWLLAWLGLELNTLGILPMIMKPNHPRATEATTKYFMIQALSAATILFASTMNSWFTGHWDISNMNSPVPMALITAALILKLGVAPAHLWYIEVIQGTQMTTALVLTTWQKIAPLTLMYMLQSHLPTNMMLLLGLTSTTMGAWIGLNQTQIRKIMASSSIAHMGWMLVAISLQKSLATMTFITYFLLTAALFTTLITTTTKTLKDLSTAWSTTPPLLTQMLLALMSLGGLPPLTGFMPKLLIIKELTMTGLTPFGTVLALSSLLSLFFYLRLAHLAALSMPPSTTNTEQKWRFKLNHQMITTPILMFSTMMLPLTPLIYLTT
uniref:NADH-ubiquinone oxidoreductase chain 2 n=2 Tax=Paroedura picta TaxID=143630 RepID=A0A455VND3_9SAUR|nr:NADH dehydrogenase subunit 2 [Paroedura picta]